MNWRPILEGCLRDRALEAADAVATALRDPESLSGRVAEARNAGGPAPASLGSGRAGWAVLHDYLAEATGDRRDRLASDECLEHALEWVAAERSSAAFYSGFTGVAWALEHLRRRGPDDVGEDPNESVDEALTIHLERGPWQGHYDLVSGLVGIGVYALERLPSASAARCLEKVIESLARWAEVKDEGAAWWTPPQWIEPQNRDSYPDGYYNLGVAHGIPGIVGLLSGARAWGIASDGTADLLEKSVTWLLHSRLPGPGPSSYSYYVAPGVEPIPARTAWCYGDPGIAACLLRAAQAARRDDWREAAVELALRSSLRAVESSGVRDPGLCHGATGLAQIYNRFFQTTEDDRFREAALVWYRRALDLRQPGGGVAGFTSWRLLDSGSMGWAPDSGLLAGAPGTALALLAGATPIEPRWDRFLLMSVSGCDEDGTEGADGGN